MRRVGLLLAAAGLAALLFTGGCGEPGGSPAGVAAAVQDSERSDSRDSPRKSTQPRDDARSAAKTNGDAKGSSAADPVERGRYIVHHVAMCIQCHTPRTASGELDRTRLLSGARMPVQSPYPSRQWGFYAPKLAGLPGGWSGDDLKTFLMTGDPPRGPAPRPPMPPFRMTAEDAAAVVAYLKSLESR